MGWLSIDRYSINTEFIENIDFPENPCVKIYMLEGSAITFHGLKKADVIIIKKSYDELKEWTFHKKGTFMAHIGEGENESRIHIAKIEKVMFLYYSEYSDVITATYYPKVKCLPVDHFGELRNPKLNLAKLRELNTLLNCYTTKTPVIIDLQKEFIKPTFIDNLKRVIKFFRKESI